MSSELEPEMATLVAWVRRASIEQVGEMCEQAKGDHAIQLGLAICIATDTARFPLGREEKQ